MPFSISGLLFSRETDIGQRAYIYIYIYINVCKSSQRMNLRDVGSETSDNDTVQANKMINKRLKCSTPAPIYIYRDKLINMEVVEYIYIYIYI